MAIAVSALLAYLIGGIPWGYVVPKLVKGIDVRTVGSGNIGATNVGRALGSGWGIAVFVLDAAKGFVPAFVLAPRIAVAGPLSGLPASVVWCEVASGLAAILGHMFPVYLGFRGGKGVATSAGVFGGLAPVPIACALGAWGLVLAGTRFMSLASITGAAVLPIAMVVLDRDRALGERWPVFALCVLASVLVVVRHRANVKRLLAGTEPRIGAKKEEAPTA